jgi:hypothetical protein
MKTTEVVVPACVVLGSKKYYLNMNKFRNWHYIVSNKIKKQFNLLVLPEVQYLPKMTYISSLEYTLIIPSKRKRDRMNIYSIVDKFFCDALQNYGKIEDDSDDYIGKFIFNKTEYMKDKPENIRVLVKISYI